MREIEVWALGPQQIPFGFAMAERLPGVLVSEQELQTWEAGQEVELQGVRYIVAKQLLPEAGKISLTRLC